MSDITSMDLETEIAARDAAGPKEWIELPLPDSWSATEGSSEAFIYFQIDPSLTNYVNRIIEGYEYLGVMSTVDGKTGIMVLRTTESQRPLALDMLSTLPQVKAFVKRL